MLRAKNADADDNLLLVDAIFADCSGESVNPYAARPWII